MDLISWYVLFSLTTSLVSIYELYNPVLGQLEEDVPDHNMIQYKYITYFIFFVSGLLLAPVLIFSCIIPSFGQRFRVALLEALKKT